jgi:hypothetical protein
MKVQPTRLQRVTRLVVAFMVASAALYAAFGGFLIYRAYAQQTYSWVLPTPNQPQPPQVSVPTGSDDKSVNAFFEYNQLRHLNSLRETYFIDPYYLGTMYLVIGVILLISYVLTFSWFARLRAQGDLYPVEVYNAYLTERGGPVDKLNWVAYAVLLSYMVTYTVINLIGGQYY